MMNRFEKRLIEHIRHEGYTPSRLDTLIADLGIETDEADEFRAAVSDLGQRGIVVVSTGGVVQLPSIEEKVDRSPDGTVQAVFRKIMKGGGFAQPLDPVRERSIYVDEAYAKDALSGDTVKIKVWRDKGRERATGMTSYAAEITEIVKRKRTTFSGEIVKKGGQWVVYPDGKEISQPIVVRDAESKNVRDGLKVVVDLVVFPEMGMLAEGVITKVLGEAGRPDVETQATIAAYNLPGEFPEECREQAREVTEEYDRQIAAFQAKGIDALTGQWGPRADLTNDFIITIDPPDAKDYDDAISIRRSGDGWELGVHIADVAHFIPPGSPVDEEARDRANSVYLPRLVIPMIPELLSNGICSLQEGVYRFCKSAFMTYDADGKCRSEGVANTLIKSAKRLTYLEAQALIDGNIEEARKHAKTPPKYTDQLLETLRDMNACAKAIQRRRKRDGMISLELPDANLIYDETGRVVDAEPEDDAFTHTLIEMFMVEANEVVARLFERYQVPLLRRVHPEPVPGNVEDMRKTAMVAGFRIPKSPSREELQTLLDGTRGTPAARAVHMAVLRTLTKAEYSPLLIGHFALASKAYAHFTSPIRRYADLTVHRCTAEYLRRTSNGTHRPSSEEDRKSFGRSLRDSKMCETQDALVELGRHATMREANAAEAEESLKKFLVLQLLADKLGETFPGAITGVNNRGVFVQIDKFLIDGFIKKEDLPGDVTRDNQIPMWRMDQRSGALVDARSGRSFNTGDSVVVKIAAVDLAKRTLDLVLDDPASRAAGKKKPVKGAEGLTLGGVGGGLTSGGGAGFGNFKTGGQRRSQKSKARDKRKPDWRRDR
jgi:ribonuclease R